MDTEAGAGTARLILGLAGPIGSGKTTIARRLVTGAKTGFKRIVLGLPFSETLKILDKELTRDNFVAVSTSLREAFPERGAFLANWALRQIAKLEARHPGGLYVVEGIRWPETHRRLRDFARYRLVAVDAPRDVRYQRVRNRNEKIGEVEMTRERFLEEESLPTEIELPLFIGDADHLYENTGREGDLFTTVDRYVRSVLS